MNLWVPFEIIKNHIILKTGDRRFLVSTGSPITLLRSEAVQALSHHQSLMEGIISGENEKLNITLNLWNQLPLLWRFAKRSPFTDRVLSEISDFINIPVDGLIGTDYLMDMDISIDPLSETVIFCPSKARSRECCKGVQMNIETHDNIPVINLIYERIEYKAFLDTGSCISYVDKSLIQDLAPVKKNVQDYLPAYGRFETDIYELKISIGNTEINMRFDVLPPRLADALKQTGINFIIGTDILKDFAMYLSLEGKFLILNKIEIAPEGSPERWIQKLNATPSYFLINNIPVESIKDDFIGNGNITKAIEDRMLFLFEGSTREHLKRLLAKVKRES